MRPTRVLNLAAACIVMAAAGLEAVDFGLCAHSREVYVRELSPELAAPFFPWAAAPLAPYLVLVVPWLVILLFQLNELRKEEEISNINLAALMLAAPYLAFSVYEIIPTGDFWFCEANSTSYFLLAEAPLPVLFAVALTFSWGVKTITRRLIGQS